MPAYYNEHEPFAAEWLRNLIKGGHIAPGDVDDRSIVDVRPCDLVGYEQCHFFAGIGIWSYALRAIGWPDDRPIWTGSCPCQPFSVAGKGLGFADERHLWPYWHWLIEQRRPDIVVGEQVGSKDVGPWLDLVFDDLEAMEYACGAVAFPAAGVGAPNIRDRLYWLAGAMRAGWAEGRPWPGHGPLAWGGGAGRLADASSERQHRRADSEATIGDGGPATETYGWRAAGLEQPEGCGEHLARGLGLAPGPGSQGQPDGRGDVRRSRRPAAERAGGEPAGSMAGWRPGASPTSGFWRDPDWLRCRDGKWRPVEPATFTLADGYPGRVGRLRAYGNAINAEAAIAFLEACFE